MIRKRFQTHPLNPELLPGGALNFRLWDAIFTQDGAVSMVLSVIIQDQGIFQVTPQALIVFPGFNVVLVSGRAVIGRFKNAQFGEFAFGRVQDVALPFSLALKEDLAFKMTIWMLCAVD
jgi:hypothetical protein